jgi:hypothetical protein
VISVTTTGNKNVGVDWSTTLGQNGLSLSGTVQTNLDATFGLVPFRVFSPVTTGTTAPALTNGGTNVILGPVTFKYLQLQPTHRTFLICGPKLPGKHSSGFTLGTPPPELALKGPSEMDSQPLNLC